MKIKKFNEEAYIDNDTIIKIRDIILDYVDLIEVPYTENDMTIDSNSVDFASKKIYEMLLKDGINFEELKNYKKYNI